MGVLKERNVSRSGTIGRQGDSQRLFVAHDIYSLQALDDLINQSTAVLEWNGRKYAGYTYSEMENSTSYEVTVYYREENERDRDPPPAGTARFRFDVAGKSVTIHRPAGESNSRPRYAGSMPGWTSEDPLDRVLIGDNGVLDEQPKGAEVVVPEFGFSFEYTIPGEQLTWDYIQTVRRLVGKTNAQAWLEFLPEEVLLESVSGSMELGEDSTITFNFKAGETLFDYRIDAGDAGDGFGTYWIVEEFKPHDYLDLQTKMWLEPGTSAKYCIIVSWELWQIYPTGDFSLLGIPGAS